jgi:hypothetical protein
MQLKDCPDIILTLFKRVLFNTSNIITSMDETILKKCMLGLQELFFPLSLDIVFIPILPQTLLEYLTVCDHSLIGIVQTIDE